MAALLYVVITLLDVYSLEYRIELKLFVVYLIVHNYDSVLATAAAARKPQFHFLLDFSKSKNLGHVLDLF